MILFDDLPFSCANMISGTHLPRSLLDYRMTTAEARSWEEFFTDVPAWDTLDDIIRQWESAKRRFPIHRRKLPQPIWERTGWDEDGTRAWEHLASGSASTVGPTPMSVYVHIPFCDRRCAFCDCYSMPIQKASTSISSSYVSALLSEMEHWTTVLRIGEKRVATVHFGGGTPSYLNNAQFARIVRQCRDCYAIDGGTELALEVTTSLLDDNHLDFLQELGFNRIHVGVQTLEDGIRVLIGRREEAACVVRKLSRAIERGFVVSVDLLLGIPGQTVSGFYETLHRMTDVGVHGVSLYQMQSSSRNQRFVRITKERDKGDLFEYLLLQLAENYLCSHGFRKNHFDHFALPDDRNLYSTHAGRGEDLLGLGTTADGVFGYYHYRHPRIKEYLNLAAAGLPVIEGGIMESPLEQRIRPAVVSLMMAALPEDIVHDFGIESLRDAWLESLLVRVDSQTGECSLTANGSWFIYEMINHLRNAVMQNASPG